MRTSPRKIWLGVLGAACMMAAGCPSACDEVTKIINPSADAVKTVTVSPATVQLNVGQTQQFTVDVQPSNAPDKSVTWSVSPVAAGTIDATGVLTPQGSGTAIVSATSVATKSVAGFATVTIGAAPPKNPPLIRATFISVVNGPNYLGDPQSVQVCTDSSCATPITDATVTVNGSTLAYDPLKLRYRGALTLSAGASYSLKVTSGGFDYTASGTQFATFPTLTTPPTGTTWNAGAANTMVWTGSTTAAGAVNFVGIVDGAGRVFYPSGDKPLEIPITATTHTIPAGWTSVPGDYYVYVGIGTPGIGNSGAPGLPIANAAAGSGLSVGGMVGISLVHTF